MLDRLFRFFGALSARKFYGETVIKWEAGRPHGQILVKEAYLEDTLPVSPEGDAELRKVVARIG